MPVPIEVRALERYRIWVRYSDGAEGIVDLSDLAGRGVFILWDDEQEFRKVSIGPGGEITWGDQIDLCPDAIYLRLTGNWTLDKNPPAPVISRAQCRTFKISQSGREAAPEP